MYPKQHAIYGLIFSIVLFILFPKIGLLGAIIIFLSSVFIDVDHYLVYVFRKKSLNLKNAYCWFDFNGKKYDNLPKEKRKRFFRSICWFHGIEAIILLLLLTFISELFFFVITGFIFHIFLDYLGANKTKIETHPLVPSYELRRIKKHKGKIKHIEYLKKKTN